MVEEVIVVGFVVFLLCRVASAFLSAITGHTFYGLISEHFGTAGEMAEVIPLQPRREH